MKKAMKSMAWTAKQDKMSATDKKKKAFTESTTDLGKVGDKAQKRLAKKKEKKTEANSQDHLADAKNKLIERIQKKNIKYSTIIKEEEDHLEKLQNQIQELSDALRKKMDKVRQMNVDKLRYRKAFLYQFDIDYHITKSKYRKKWLSDHLNHLEVQREKTNKQIQKYKEKIHHNLHLLSEHDTPEKAAQPVITPKPSSRTILSVKPAATSSGRIA